MYGKGLKPLSIATVAMLAVALSLVFFYAPLDADQGFIQKIFYVPVLITGAIWAKASWGHWWVWDEPTLVSFLIVFLLYATYYPFRYAIEDRDRQARYASVFAVTAGAFVPLNFMAVRMAQSLVHPRTFATAEGGM